MRSWGSPAITENQDAITDLDGKQAKKASDPVNGDVVGNVKKTKPKSSDKGGTEKKAKSKIGSLEIKVDDLPVKTLPDGGQTSKKRKRDNVPEANGNVNQGKESVTATGTSEPVSDKTLKRIRRTISKISMTNQEMTLAKWLDQICRAKEKPWDLSDVMRCLKVTYTDGRWILTPENEST